MNYIKLCIFLLVVPGSLWAKDIHVCMNCAEGQVRTIERAMKYAENGDRIIVHWEPGYPILMEHVVIDKAITLTSYAEGQGLENFDVHPTLTAPFNIHSEVIDVTVAGVKIEGLNITNIYGVNDINVDDTDFSNPVGIRVRAPAQIRFCEITKCRTGILLDYLKNIPFARGSTITSCRIGYPTFTQWKPGALNHPGNAFGIVILNPANSKQKGVNLPVDTVKNTAVISNRFYGIVFAQGRQPNMDDCLVELNGIRPFREAQKKLSKEKKLIWTDQ